ncbi:MAG: phosphodiester glycosidase family protein [Oscillospiraceae bacterium]|nr:phosphodiester glycosidase family protein [Oscillospiraceae bacterium]
MADQAPKVGEDKNNVPMDGAAGRGTGSIRAGSIGRTGTMVMSSGPAKPGGSGEGGGAAPTGTRPFTAMGAVMGPDRMAAPKPATIVMSSDDLRPGEGARPEGDRGLTILFRPGKGADVAGGSGPDRDGGRGDDLAGGDGGRRPAPYGRKPRRRLRAAAKAASIAFGALALIYVLAVFTDIPILSDARILWIETAMTTNEHQWLATRFFPAFVIEDVMSRQLSQEGIVSTPINFRDRDERQESEDDPLYVRQDEGGDDSVIWYNDGDAEGEYMVDLAGGGGRVRYLPGELDGNGNMVLVSDLDNGITIIEVSSMWYTGKIMIIDDPAQVVVRHTKYAGLRGQLITEYLADHGAVAGINANGFQDDEGVGRGGQIIGWSASDGVYWGEGEVGTYITTGFDRDDNLIIGKIHDFGRYGFRDLVQFMPALIVDGVVLVTSSAGYGLHPRTAIGQRADGSIMLIVIDGRQPGYSLGLTVDTLAEIMHSYGVINAGVCDGGSSSVMAYDGEIITRPSTPMEFGRYLPNAIMVMPRSYVHDRALGGGSAAS